MSTHSSKLDAPPQTVVIDELDRVRLTRTFVDKDQTLEAGWEGIVLFCYESKAYEVEFDAIDYDFFQIPAEHLEKILV